MELKVKKLTDTAKLPTKAFDYEAGWDFYADKDIILHRGETLKVNTGIAIELPREYCLVLKDRSSYGSKGVHILAGVIDSSYRGEIMICMHYLDEAGFGYQINKGDKIAQGLILPVPVFTLKEVNELSDSVRGVLGFGSTGN